jgi:hypothetical protein
LKNPQKKIAILERELEKLGEEQKVINENNVGKVPYNEAVAVALGKLQRDKERIQERLDKIRAVAGLPPAKK